MKRRLPNVDSGIIILILIIVVIIVAIVFLIIQLRTDAITDSLHEERPIVIAFLVTDDDELLCTEVLLYHPRTAKAALFDVPGEWGDVLEQSNRMDKIDVLFRKNAPNEYLTKVAELLDIDITWHVEMDLDAVESILDLLEGLELFIANPVEIVDEDRLVLLPSGSLVLDGAKMREYLSYSDPNEADLERRGRYQKFVQALLRRLSNMGEYAVSDVVFPVFEKQLKTNIGSRALKSLILEFAKLNADRIVSKHVHGDRVTVDEQILLFPHFDGKLIRESVRQTVESLSNVDVVGEDELTVLIEILNGTDKNGLATRTAETFSDFGYDVLPASNADRDDYEFTLVIANTGDLAKAQQVANIIRCSRVQVGEQPGSESAELFEESADVTIILGLDFDGRYCKE
jgi:polyisoprenyl-teichoic acid--peptidoglycan teichoic acid transferase